MDRQKQTMDVYCDLTGMTFVVEYIEHPPEPDVGFPKGYVELVDYSLVRDSRAETYIEQLLLEELSYD